MAKFNDKKERSIALIAMVLKLFREHVSLTEIAKIVGCSVSLVSNIVEEYAMAKRAIGNCVITTNVKIGHKGQVFDLEEDIIQALEPSFNTEELTGWELKQFNKTTE